MYRSEQCHLKILKSKSMRLLLGFMLLGLPHISVAQIDIKRKVNDVKRKVNNRIDNTINRGIDKAIDATEDVLKGEKKTAQPGAGDAGKDGNGKQAAKSDTGQTKSTAIIGRTDEKSGAATSDSLLEAYVSKFDFVPGEKILGVESFDAEQIGDFPNLWDTDASGEVVTIPGRVGKWLKLGKDGFFLPDLFLELPENFTLEFDVAVNESFSWFSSPLSICISTSESTSTWKPDKRQRSSSGILFRIHPVNAEATGGRASMLTYVKGTEVMNSEQSQDQLSTAWRLQRKPLVVHVSIWKQGQRVRLYLNEKKYWDLPRAFSKDLKHDKFFLLTAGGKEDEHFFVSNFRLAAGTPDTRSKLLSEGSLTTSAIVFDVNSDRIKEESMGMIREIATVLKENPGVRVRIIGHTDSDGNAELNLQLSKRRAASVQAMLIKHFGIQESRLETDGKGAAEPVLPNNSSLNKAQNRRVQFVKL